MLLRAQHRSDRSATTAIVHMDPVSFQLTWTSSLDYLYGLSLNATKRIPLFQVKWVFLSYLHTELIKVKTIFWKPWTQLLSHSALANLRQCWYYCRHHLHRKNFFFWLKTKKPFYISWSACAGDNCGSFITVQLSQDLSHHTMGVCRKSAEWMSQAPTLHPQMHKKH